jgi:2-keto-4-pentenoate hydratase/2-oxohepta-3-ene-1,7-dioic acid hydratase in catechol pathway
MTLWARYRLGSEIGFGIITDESVVPYKGDMFARNEVCGPPIPLATVDLLPPCAPRKFIGLWNNFRALAKKIGQPEPEYPLYFVKASSSVVPTGAAIRRPRGYEGRIMFEGELGIVIGARCCALNEAQAERAIFGYTCVNDVTANDWLTDTEHFPQWARAKSADTFGPVGPYIATGLDWSSLTVRTRVDGRERQNYPIADIILSPARIVSLLSYELTLEPGDLIACGTSLGVVPLRPGNVVEVQIDGVGTLTNHLDAGEPS